MIDLFLLKSYVTENVRLEIYIENSLTGLHRDWKIPWNARRQARKLRHQKKINSAVKFYKINLIKIKLSV